MQQLFMLVFTEQTLIEPPPHDMPNTILENEKTKGIKNFELN